MADPAVDRMFPLLNRGEFRELLLASYRAGLNGAINPDTGEIFTDLEIAACTAKGSTRWNEADALDRVAQVDQSRALWLAMQARPDLASTSSLKTIWAPLWLPDGYLPASGASGDVTATAAAGVIWTGSATVPDPGAVQGTDPAGLTYQVLGTVTTPVSGEATLTLIALDTGTQTNIPAGTKITWSNAPAGAQPTATADNDFTGGLGAETDADFVKRLLRAIRHRAAAGNPAQFSEWTSTAGKNAIDVGAIYPCAFHAGSVLVVPVQKRGNPTSPIGPLARIPSVGTLTLVRSYLVPAASAVVPAQVHVIVAPPVAVPSDVTLSLSLPVGSPSGWTDLQPWPGQSAGTPTTITSVTDQLHFRIDSPLALPAGVTAPAMMVWNQFETSRFATLAVFSVTSAGGTLYNVVLSSAPTDITLSAGQWVSPGTAQSDVIAETIEAYADSLGPGEVIPVGDSRRHRAARFPPPAEEYPFRFGTGGVQAFLLDALGGSLSESVVESVSVSTPPLPVDGNAAPDPAQGPGLIVLGNVAVYDLQQ